MSDNDEKRDRPLRLVGMASDLSIFFEERQRLYAERAQEFGYAKENFRILAKNFASSPDSEVLGQAESSLNEFGKLVRSREQSLDRFMFDVSSATYAMSTSTTTAMTVSYFETQGVWNERLNFPAPPPQWSKDRISEYASKLELLDPEMGKLARSVWQHFYGGSESEERASLLAMRQLYDHLFSLLAPDEEVRTSGHFKLKESTKPNQIHRKERLLFAAEARVRDPDLASVLASEGDQVIDTYEKLNQLHARQSLDREAAKRVLVSMQAVIEQWVDGLEL